MRVQLRPCLSQNTWTQKSNITIHANVCVLLLKWDCIVSNIVWHEEVFWSSKLNWKRDPNFKCPSSKPGTIWMRKQFSLSCRKTLTETKSSLTKRWNEAFKSSSRPAPVPSVGYRGLCSASPINHTLIKAFCLVKWAAWETLWKGSYHLEAATREKTGGSHTLNSSESQCAVLEPFRKLDSSRRIPSKDRFSGM